MKGQERPAVLLMAYGGPESVTELPAFLRDVMKCPVPPAALERATERYVRIGGRSPLRAITQRQARALRVRLKDLRVEAAFRHSRPTIEEAVDALSREGVARVIGLPMTPFLSLSAASGYRRELERAAKQVRVDAELLEGWHEHPGLIEAYAERVRQAVEGRPEATYDETGLVFVSHSLPERLLAHGDPYTKHVVDAACAVADSTGFEEWNIAFLGRGETGSWLGPEPGDIFADFSERGLRRTVVVPLGYLAENAETLYDCDIECKAAAEKQCLDFARAAALDDSPTLIAALADLVHHSKVR